MVELLSHGTEMGRGMIERFLEKRAELLFSRVGDLHAASGKSCVTGQRCVFLQGIKEIQRTVKGKKIVADR